MNKFLASCIAAVTCLRATAATAAQAQTVEASELHEAKSAWLQCVQSQRDINGYPPNWLFQPAVVEVRAYSDVQCKAHMERTRAALTASEIAAGRQPSKMAIDRLMDETKDGFGSQLLPPNATRAGVTQSSPALVENGARAAASPSTCKGSVKRGLEAYNAGNYETAFCYWWPKALKGDAAAQNNIGLLFENGSSSSTPQSNDKAAEWYLASAKQGLVLGMRNLARVQQRLGHYDAANSWLTMASAADAQQAQQKYQLQQGLNSAAYALGCAMAGGCASAVTISPVQPNGSSASQSGLGSPLPSLGTVGGSSWGPRSVLCPDGSYVSGPPCRLAPNGTYVSGTPRLAPNGTYVGGTGRIILCPDGSYVAGTRCILTPSGKYVGSN